MENFKFLQDLNYVDIGFVLILVVLSWRGAARGFFAETFGIIGVVLAFVFSGKYYHLLDPYLKSAVASPETREIVAYALTFLVIMLLVSLAGKILNMGLTVSLSSLPNHVLGGMVGFAKGIFICALILALVKRLAPDAKLLSLSVLAKPIGDVAKVLYSFLPNFI